MCSCLVAFVNQGFWGSFLSVYLVCAYVRSLSLNSAHLLLVMRPQLTALVGLPPKNELPLQANGNSLFFCTLLLLSGNLFSLPPSLTNWQISKISLICKVVFSVIFDRNMWKKVLPFTMFHSYILFVLVLEWAFFGRGRRHEQIPLNVLLLHSPERTAGKLCCSVLRIA